MRGDQNELTDRYASARHFQLWLYQVGHRQLVLRSVKGGSYTTREDILFKGVRSLHLPTATDGLTVNRDDQGFVTGGNHWTGHVDAEVCFVAQDEGGYSIPAPLLPRLIVRIRRWSRHPRGESFRRESAPCASTV